MKPVRLLPLEADAPGTLVGGKAAALGRLRRAGFAVPPGIVLTVPLCRELRGQGVRGSAEWPHDLLDELTSALVANDCLDMAAVRSSAVGEDGAARSFAGQLATTLHVRGVDAITRAAATCWESGSSARVRSYARGGGVPAAVIVQRMILPTWSGIAFSVDPLGGDASQMLVEVVAGTAERLCDGGDAPYRYTMDKVSRTVRRQQAPASGQDGQDGREGREGPDASTLRLVAELTLAVERYSGGPQDIEWALDQHGMHLIQARPITAMRRPDPPARGLSIVESLLGL